MAFPSNDQSTDVRLSKKQNATAHASFPFLDCLAQTCRSDLARWDVIHPGQPDPGHGYFEAEAAFHFGTGSTLTSVATDEHAHRAE